MPFSRSQSRLASTFPRPSSSTTLRLVRWKQLRSKVLWLSMPPGITLSRRRLTPRLKRPSRCSKGKGDRSRRAPCARVDLFLNFKADTWRATAISCSRPLRLSPLDVSSFLPGLLLLLQRSPRRIRPHYLSAAIATHVSAHCVSSALSCAKSTPRRSMPALLIRRRRSPSDIP